MITNSPVIQLAMVLLAVAILLLYIRPTITEVRAVQDQIAVYENELTRVTDVNTRLSEHTSAINKLPLTDVQALERYLPNSLDEINIMRDLQAIAAEIGVTVGSIDFGGKQTQSQSEGEEPTNQTLTGIESISFSFSGESDYDTLKNFLRALEVNNYQFAVDSLEVTPSQEGLLSFELNVLVYVLQAVTPTPNSDTSAPIL